MSEKIVSGKLEAFSFQKKVVLIGGKWYRFDSNLEGTVRNLKKDSIVKVKVTEEGQYNNKLVEVLSDNAEVESSAAPAPQGDRSVNIFKSVALQQAVAFAQGRTVGSTSDITLIADAFLKWLETGEHMDLPIEPEPTRPTPRRTKKTAEKGQNGPSTASKQVEPPFINGEAQG